MSYNIDWNVVSAIGTCLGALATFGACLIALWQTKIAYKKSLKIIFNDNIKLSHPSIPEEESEYVNIQIINTGNRDIAISEWAYELKDDMKAILLVNFTKYLPTIFPITVEVDNKKEIFYEKKFFLNNVKEAIGNNDINKQKKIKFSVTDVTGRKYYFYSPKKAKYYLKLNPNQQAENER